MSSPGRLAQGGAPGYQVGLVYLVAGGDDVVTGLVLLWLVGGLGLFDGWVDGVVLIRILIAD